MTWINTPPGFDELPDCTACNGTGTMTEHAARRIWGDTKITLEEVDNGNKFTIDLLGEGQCNECKGSGKEAMALVRFTLKYTGLEVLLDEEDPNAS